MTNPTNAVKHILEYLDEMQAIDIVRLDVQEQTSVTDEMIVCSGRSSRHVKSIGSFVLEKMKHSGLAALSHTGLGAGEWVLLDFGDVIVHVMQADIRAFYNLEELWGTND